jgi:hypothetical protein
MQVLASEKPPKLCPEVHLGSIKSLKAQTIEISKAEEKNSPRICSIAQLPPPPKMKMGVYTSFTIFPSGLYLTKPTM